MYLLETPQAADCEMLNIEWLKINPLFASVHPAWSQKIPFTNEHARKPTTTFPLGEGGKRTGWRVFFFCKQ